MFRMKSVCLTCLLALLALAALPAVAQDTDPGNLEARVKALETRLANMEKMLNQRLASIEGKLRNAGNAPNPLEGEAQQAYTNISRLAAEGKMTEAKTEMDNFMKKYGSTEIAKRARKLNDELSVVGKDAPAEWGIDKWYQGESDVDLAGDKTTLLVFWEVWCPHCQREVPKMEALFESLKGDGLQVVGLTRITKSATDEKVANFIKEKEIGYPIAKENGSISQYFNVSGIPAAAVVKDGKVVWRGHPARLNETMIKGWM
jgi:thiol-disulfide isomerase/thioredoxin